MRASLRGSALLWLLSIAGVVYGSLYPFQFHVETLGSALAALLDHDDIRDQPLAGIVGNILFYMPVGLFGFLVWRSLSASRAVAIVVMLALGTALSLTMETLQFFDTGRTTTVTDVYLNMAGTLAGAVLGLGLTVWQPRPMPTRVASRLYEEPAAALVLALFLAYRLFPYIPTLDIHAWWHAVAPMFDGHPLAWADITRYLVLWAVIGVCLRRIAGGAASRWLLPAGFVATAGAQILILHNDLTRAELIAAIGLIGIWPTLVKLPRSALTALVALALAVLVVCLRLLPFDWQATGHGYDWLPFASALHGSMSINLQALLEKTFLYSALIWLLHKADAPLVAAGIGIAIVLFAMSLLQTHLPGRSADLTDPVLALVMTAILRTIIPAERAGSRAARRRAAYRPVRGDPHAAAGDGR